MLIIARHGQTDLNAQGRVQGRLDAPLNELGRRHAADVGRALAHASEVIASPLQRAVATAAAIGKPVTTDERWLEIDFGDYDGLLDHEIPPEVWHKFRTDPHYAAPNGESQSQVFDRVSAACRELAPRAVESDVVVVSHVSAIKAAMIWAMGGDRETLLRMRLSQASISRILIAPDATPILFSFNEINHLDQSG